ncbi:MAG: pseudouridine synthase [Endozoicomonas sp.]
MGIARQPSVVTMPPEETRFATVLDFLTDRFPVISEAGWRQRLVEKKVHWDCGTAIEVDAAYAPYQRVFYFREVENEPVIPFQEDILFQDDELLVACKPHFLPVTPGGKYVQECLMNRLRRRTGIETLTPIHRIDRETAGIVLFSVNPSTRSQYHDLFVNSRISKTYQAVAHLPESREFMSLDNRNWSVKNRIASGCIASGQPKFRMTITEGQPNAHSIIHSIETRNSLGLFQLHPITGKRHQLRLHMASLGFPLVNDRFYPELQDESADDFSSPLQLLAKQVDFADPVSGRNRSFVSERKLNWQAAANS